MDKAKIKHNQESEGRKGCQNRPLWSIPQRIRIIEKNHRLSGCFLRSRRLNSCCLPSRLLSWGSRLIMLNLLLNRFENFFTFFFLALILCSAFKDFAAGLVSTGNGFRSGGIDIEQFSCPVNGKAFAKD